MAAQQERGLLACPMCGSSQIEKQLSAPRLNLLPSRVRAVPGADASRAPADAAANPLKPGAAAPAHALLAAEHAQWQAIIRHVIETTENVGQDFAEQARRIHYKEMPARSIRGVATRQEAEALLDEGIEVACLPFPVIGKGELN